MKRKFLINKKYQIGMAAISSAAAAFTFVIVLGLISGAVWMNSDKLGKLMNNQKGLAEKQNELFTTLIFFSMLDEKQGINVSKEKIEKDMLENSNKLNESFNLVSGISKINLILLVVLAGFAVLQTAFLFFWTIRRAHRTAGPLFVLNRYITEIKNGKVPEIRKLRPKDDFAELFQNFKEMADAIKKREAELRGEINEKNSIR